MTEMQRGSAKKAVNLAEIALTPPPWSPPVTDFEPYGREIVEKFPQLHEIAAGILEDLEGPTAFRVIDDLNKLPIPDDRKAAAYVALCHLVGLPSSHNNKNEIVWHVRERRTEGRRRADRTFSEKTGEAPFHTDSAFSAHPEEFFGLYCVRMARCGGGQTKLIHADHLRAALEASPEGRSCLEVMAREEYPFKTPLAFDSGATVHTGKLFHDGILRYRHDVVMKGVEEAPERVTTEMLVTLKWFNKFLENKVKPIEMFLQDGQAIFVNNNRMLHARSDYHDAQRHLIRVRMHRHGWTEAAADSRSLAQPG